LLAFAVKQVIVRQIAQFECLALDLRSKLLLLVRLFDPPVGDDYSGRNEHKYAAKNDNIDNKLRPDLHRLHLVKNIHSVWLDRLKTNEGKVIQEIEILLFSGEALTEFRSKHGFPVLLNIRPKISM
jgi:hypothetical protein